MSMNPTRAVPKWPIHYGNTFDFDLTSILLGLGAGALAFYLTQKFVLKKCLR